MGYFYKREFKGLKIDQIDTFGMMKLNIDVDNGLDCICCGKIFKSGMLIIFGDLNFYFLLIFTEK